MKERPNQPSSFPITRFVASFDDLLDRIASGIEHSVEYKGRSYLLSDCAYWGNWVVLCEQDDEEPQSYRDEEEFVERATLHGDLLRDIGQELVLV